MTEHQRRLSTDVAFFIRWKEKQIDRHERGPAITRERNDMDVAKVEALRLAIYLKARVLNVVRPDSGFWVCILGFQFLDPPKQFVTYRLGSNCGTGATLKVNNANATTIAVSFEDFLNVARRLQLTIIPKQA